jgi:hypothetical protein
LQGIYAVIEQHIAGLYDAGRAQTLSKTIRAAQARIEQEQAERIEDQHSKFHLQLMALLLAGYRSLQGLISKEEALALLKRATIEPSLAAIGEGVKYALDQAPDPMQVLVEASRQRETDFFGSSFTFERYQDDQQAYILHVRRCFYERFARENGVPELMQILCEWDWSWARAIEPARHAFSFELPTTLGYGADMCRFCFRRLSR